MYCQDPAHFIEQIEEHGARCYDCVHHQRIGIDMRAGRCDKNVKGYPKEGKSTCILFQRKRR